MGTGARDTTAYSGCHEELMRCDYCDSKETMGYTNSTWLCDPVPGLKPDHNACLACYDSANP